MVPPVTMVASPSTTYITSVSRSCTSTRPAPLRCAPSTTRSGAFTKSPPLASAAATLSWPMKVAAGWLPAALAAMAAPSRLKPKNNARIDRLLTLHEAFINSFDKLAGSAVGRFCVVARIPILCQVAFFDFRQCLALFDRCLHAIAHNRHHVPVLHHFPLVAHAAVARNHVRSAFFFVPRHRDIEDVIQRVDFALDGPAVVHIDKRIAGGDEDIAGRDHVGAPEPHQAVAIGMGIGLIKHLNRFIVEEEVLVVPDEFGVGGPGSRRGGRSFAGGSAHPVQDIQVRDDLRACSGLSESLRISASTASLVPARPVSTTSTPSLPTCTAILPPAPAIM